MAKAEEKKRVLEQVFQEAQQSYRKAMEHTFAIQVLALEFARKLLDELQETLPTQETEENRELLRSLYIRSTGQREELERLMQETNQTYRTTLQAVFKPHEEEA